MITTRLKFVSVWNQSTVDDYIINNSNVSIIRDVMNMVYLKISHNRLVLVRMMIMMMIYGTIICMDVLIRTYVFCSNYAMISNRTRYIYIHYGLDFVIINLQIKREWVIIKIYITLRMMRSYPGASA